MDSVWIGGAILCYAAVVLFVALRVPHNQLSEFELERRAKLGDPQAIFGTRRAAAYDYVIAARWIIGLLIGLVGVACIEAWLGGWRAVIGIVILTIAIGPLARLGFIRRQSQRLYRHFESRIINGITASAVVWRVLAPPTVSPMGRMAPSSRDELVHMIDKSQEVVSSDEVRLMTGSLKFYETTAETVMTPVSRFVTVPVKEVVGPFVIHELHQSGHTVFPVVTPDGEYVGLFDSSRFTALRNHESPIVRDVMQADVLRVAADEPLDEVLRMIIASKQVCLFVIDNEQRVIGLISLSDIVHVLTGWQRHH